MALSDISSSIQGYGPSDDHKRRIQETVFGSVLGLSAAALLSFLAYLAVVVTFYGFFNETLRDLAKNDAWVFYPMIMAPPALIITFLVIPAAIKAYREQQIYKLTPNVAPITAGYFRIHPFEVSDKGQYQRPDGALEGGLAWIKRTDQPVLYLSGSSGVGKSSLVAAGMAPALAETGWSVLFVRGTGEPHSSLVRALQTNRAIFEKPPESSEPYDLLMRSARKLKLTSNARLLIVLDQFEEYLILDSDEDRATYALFLKRLVAEPIDHVHLLHVFREDYRALLFAQALPDFIPRQTGFELAPFSRVQAEAFLKGGPQVLEQRGYDVLFDGLNRIEETPGLYRPITLNMIGYVLNRQGSELAMNPARLIETYIIDCVGSGATRDYNKRVLQSMITQEGTKQQISVADIVTATGLTQVQIRAALYKLGGDGLVRNLSGDLWEISHDFMARLLDRLLGRIKAPLSQRVALPVLSVALVGWIGVVVIGLPYLQEVKFRTALERVRDAGFVSLPCQSGLCLRLERTSDANQSLLVLRAETRLLNVKELDLIFAPGLTSLDALQGMPLNRLDLTGADSIVSLDALQGMPLNELSLSDADGITSLDALRGMPLTILNLSTADGITSLDALRGMPLTILSLEDSDRITSLDALQGMPLNKLNLSSADGITSLEALRGMPLTMLDLSSTDSITSLDALRDMPLSSLNLMDADGITSFDALRGMPLTTLELEGADGFTSLDGLQGMPLTSLDLSDAHRIASLDGLQGMLLTSLDLSGVGGITSLEALRGMPLTTLNLSNADGITSLDGLQGMPLTTLDLSNADGITSLDGLQGMPLANLYLTNMHGLSSLDGLQGIPLINLSLMSTNGITSLEELKGMPLNMLDLSFTNGIISLDPLEGMPLTILDLTNAYGITSLAQLKGIAPEIIIGASDALLATLDD